MVLVLQTKIPCLKRIVQKKRRIIRNTKTLFTLRDFLKCQAQINSKSSLLIHNAKDLAAHSRFVHARLNRICNLAGYVALPTTLKLLRSSRRKKRLLLKKLNTPKLKDL